MTRKIAVIVQNRPFFGALLVHAPLLVALRRLHPRAPIVAYAPFAGAQLLADQGLADEVVVYGGAWSLWRALRAQRPDLVVSLRRKSLRVSLAVAASGALETIGFRYRLGGALLRRALPLDKSIYRGAAFLRLAEPLGADVDEDARTFVARLAAGSPWRTPAPGHVYTLIPCCSDDRKQWGLANYLDYCRAWRARDEKARFVFVLGPRERAFAVEIARSDLAGRATCLLEAELSTIARAVLESRVTVTNDCAPGHIAQMSGGPVVCVFGNWDGRSDVRVGEWFCTRRGAAYVTAEAGTATETIPVERVLEAAVRTLEGPGSARAAGT